MPEIPYLNSGVPIAEQTRTPSTFFHTAWQILVDAVKTLQDGGVGGTTLFIDGGDATNTGTPYIAIDGGSA
jgi:hypothetical protein